VLLEKPVVTDAEQAVEPSGPETGPAAFRHRVQRQPLAAHPGGGGDDPPVSSARSSTSMPWSAGWRRHARDGRTDPAISGGLCRPGARGRQHRCRPRERDVAQVAAWLEDDGNPVDVRGAVIARLASGALITMNGCGRAIPSLGSDIRVYCERGTLRTGIWGERLELQRSGAKSLRAVRSVRPKTLWQQFLDVRAGVEPNPSPPEVGLRMARLWDAIRESSARGGAVVTPVREADAA
jgi:hypothetical protein